MSDELNEFQKFDIIVRKVFSVPHSEIVKREKEYKRKRKRIREARAKVRTLASARVSRGH